MNDGRTDLRRWMRLCESPTALYHGSKRRFRVGTILRAQRFGYAFGSGYPAFEKRVRKMCEDFLEEFRPANAIPRQAAVFLVDDPAIIDQVGGYEDYVYEVEPIGPVTRCNLYWYSDLEAYCSHLEGRVDDADLYDIRRMAQGYWSAAPNDLQEEWRNQIEYLAQSARIIAIKSQAVQEAVDTVAARLSESVGAPAQQMVDAFKTKLAASKLNGKVGVSLDVTGDQDVELAHITVDLIDRGRGLATKAMRLLTKFADQYDVTLTLYIDEMAGSSGGPDVDQLYAWYSQFGFTDRDYYSHMVREPMG